MNLLRQLKKIFGSIKLDSIARYSVLGVVFAVLLIVIMGRMFTMIWGAEGAKWREVAKTIHPPTPKTIPAYRGNIYAHDGRPIAVTAPYYRLYLDFRAGALAPLYYTDSLRKANPRKAKEHEMMRDSINKQLRLLADALQEVLHTTGEKKIDKKALIAHWQNGLKKKSRFWLVTKQDISYLQYEALMRREPMMTMSRGKRPRLVKGLINKIHTKEERIKRINPFESLAKRTIGSVYADLQKDSTAGRSGLELKYDSLLRGVEGRGVSRYQAGRTVIDEIEPVQNGADIYTTLDMNKQNIVETVMRRQLDHLSADRGVAILMEVATGKILALTNLQRTPSGGYTETNNHAVSSLTEPGSTFKVASMMVALEDGVVSPSDSIDVGNGTWPIGGRVVRDHNAGRGYGRISLSQVIERSSNVGVAKIIVKGYASRPDDYVQKVRNLGFGLDLDLDIPGYQRARVRKKSDNPNTWYGTTLAWMSYGYETQIPPIYTLAFFNAIANNGRYMRPYLVQSIHKPEQKPTNIEPQVLIESICSPSTLEAIQGMLRKVVTDGTGKRLRSDFVSISGKSGTAQLSQGKQGYRGADGVSHEVSFCAYFPSEAPKYSCIVVIRDPSKQFSAGGGAMSGPVIREIAEELLSMEDPIPTDSLKRIEASEAHRVRLASGLKEINSSIYRKTLSQYTPNEAIEAKDYVRLDNTGKEIKIPAAPVGVVPSVVGMSATDAVFRLLSLGYIPSIKGTGLVVEQSVPMGAKAQRGTRVTLTLQ